MLRRSDYLICYDEGRRLASRHFVVFLRVRHNESDVQPEWRVGMAVTKKIGCAVIRNRVKRVLREFFRLHQHLLPAGADMVVIPKKHLPVETMTLDTTSRDLMPLLAQISRLPGMSAQAATSPPALDNPGCRGGSGA